MSSLKAYEELKLRRGMLHTDAVRNAVGGDSRRPATWVAELPPHHAIVIAWYDGRTPILIKTGEGGRERNTGHLIPSGFHQWQR